MKGRPIICVISVLYITLLLILIHGFQWTFIKIPEELEVISESSKVEVNGIVYKIEEKAYSQYIYIQGEQYRWQIKSKEFVPLLLGNQIHAQGEIEYFDVARNPGNFNPRSYYQGQGVVAIVNAHQITVTDPKAFFVRNKLQELRQNGVEQLIHILGQKNGGILSAIVFGEKGEMDPDQKEWYQKIGIGHIFAISGLHISILSIGIYQLLRRITGSFKIAALTASIILLAYITLTGLGVSAIRAGVMFGMKLGADVTGRIYHRLTSLAVAALCILLYNPMNLLEGGFLLSFGAILAVIYIVPKWVLVVRKMGIKNKIMLKMGEGLAVTIGIQQMLLPVILVSFFEASPYSVIVNVLVIPMMTILLGIALCGLLISVVFPFGGESVLMLAGKLLDLIQVISDSVSQLWWSRAISGTPWVLMILLYYLLLLGQMYYINYLEKRKCKDKKKYIMIIISAFIIGGLLWIKPPTNQLLVTMIDVGQGDCIFIRTPDGTTFLIDGGSTDQKEVAKYRIEPYLRSLGVSVIDYVFISHGDKDHLSGIMEMMGRQEVGIRIKQVILADIPFHDEALYEVRQVAMQYEIPVATMNESAIIEENGVEISYLYPMSNYQGELGNESSMVLSITYHDFAMLCTGDIEGESEEQLIELLKQRNRYDVLKVAHHGSNSSTPEELLEVVKPSIALLSAGVDNIYGHPHKEVMERLKSRGILCYETAKNGAVSLSYNHKNDSILIRKNIE